MGDRTKLLEVLRNASADLPDVTEKKMFGCEAFFSSTGRIFALVWKTGRIALKLPSPDRYKALASQKGAAPWSPGAKVMGAWLLVPPKLEEEKALAPWLKEAHALANAPPPRKAASKKATAKKPSANNAATKKKAAAKRTAGTATTKPKVVVRK